MLIVSFSIVLLLLRSRLVRYCVSLQLFIDLVFNHIYICILWCCIMQMIYLIRMPDILIMSLICDNNMCNKDVMNESISMFVLVSKCRIVLVDNFCSVVHTCIMLQLRLYLSIAAQSAQVPSPFE